MDNYILVYYESSRYDGFVRKHEKRFDCYDDIFTFIEKHLRIMKYEIYHRIVVKSFDEV